LASSGRTSPGGTNTKRESPFFRNGEEEKKGKEKKKRNDYRGNVALCRERKTRRGILTEEP